MVTSPVIDDWQEMINPDSLSSSVCAMPGFSTMVPWSTRTRHFPQAPFPPQGRSIMTPATSAASESKVPVGTSMDFLLGRKIIFGIMIQYYSLMDPSPCPSPVRGERTWNSWYLFTILPVDDHAYNHFYYASSLTFTMRVVLLEDV
jgi:hypothetical protein